MRAARPKKTNLVLLPTRTKAPDPRTHVFSRIDDEGELEFGCSTEMTSADALRHMMALHCVMAKMLKAVQTDSNRGGAVVSITRELVRAQ